MITDLFQEPKDHFLDPRVRRWNERLSQNHASAYLEVDWPPYLVGQTSPEMTIHLSDPDDSDTITEPMHRDDDLNAVLIANSIKAEDHEQEALRFSLALRTAFRKASLETGDGYFNAVFFGTLRELDLASNTALEPLVDELDYIHIIDREKPEGRYERCHAMIRTAIQTRAVELTRDLKYSQDEATSILVAALVDYIDRRFSVSIRRQRGWL